MYKHRKEEYFVGIKGWEDYYQVSNYGRVRSLDRTVVDSRGGIRAYKGRMLKLALVGTTDQRYYQAVLQKGGFKAYIKVHQLVAYDLMGLIKADGYYIDHINNIKTDNHTSNLQQVSPRVNAHKDRKNMSSPFIGVVRDKRGNFLARINLVGEAQHLGTYAPTVEGELEAAEAYQTALRKYNSNIDFYTEFVHGLFPIERREYLLT